MKSLGFIALILSVIGLISPLFAGAFIATLSGGLAIFAGKKCNYYGLAALGLNIANLIVFSPQKLLMHSSPDADISSILSVLTYPLLFILLIQIVGVVMSVRNIHKRNQIQAKNG